MRISQGHTCSQIFIGEKKDFMHIESIKSESCSHLTLQDFTRKHGISHTIKNDNTKTQKGAKLTEHCRKLHIKQKFTEPFHPWQNYAEHGIYDLSVMVRRTIREHKIPYTQHHWVQRWCAEVRYHAASRKLKWRTPHEA